MIKIYTDGSCFGNGVEESPRGGSAWVITLDDDKICMGSEGVSGSGVTNNRMEIEAVLNGLRTIYQHPQYFNRDQVFHIHSDSRYVVDGYSCWLNGWVKKKFRGVKNDDLWKRVWIAQCHIDFDITWVKAHNGDWANEEADQLAKSAALDCSLRSIIWY